MRPLNRHYFVLQTNPGEQFYLFTSLAGWLIRKSDRTFDPPQEFDNPNTNITNIFPIKSLQEFVKELRMRPLNRHYFVLQTNPGEQFYLFTSLAGWLIRKSGRTFDPPQEFDDPNTTITNILDIVRQMGVSIDFAPSKLKQGFGEQAIFVLDRLSDETLR